jgi:membrane-bound metal-dependent hydrolase YbcI (DUF457 family)
MDVLAHGLWGGALFGRKNRPHWRAACLLGMAPDILAFGPFLLTRIGSPGWVEFPRYVYQSYAVTHSLVVFAAVTGLVWLFRKSFPWVLGAWALHILCDIPLHSTDFFPTPYLWPLPTPLFNGVPWARRTFIIANYAALAATYATLAVWGRRRRMSS